LLDNARNKRTTGLGSRFLNNGAVSMPKSLGVFLETVFSIPSVQSGYKEEFS
jgi:hypothetical protein